MDDWDLDTPAHKPVPRPETEPAPTGPMRRNEPVPAPGAVSASGLTSEGRPSAGGARPVRPRTLRQKVRHRLVWIGPALAVLLIGVLVGLFIARSQAADDAAALTETRVQLGQLQNALSQSEDRNWTYYRANEALQAELDRALSSGGGPTIMPGYTPGPGGEGGTYGDGVYLVGKDILPGTYDGVITGKLGYWARLKGTDGSVGAIIANAIPHGPFVLTVYPSDEAVELRGVEIRSR
jgi:hypothetical protein